MGTGKALAESGSLAETRGKAKAGEEVVRADELGGSKEEREVRLLVGRYLDGEDEAKREIERFEEGLVLRVLDSVSGSTRDSKVLRRAVALTREILERGEPERMQEDERPGEGVSSRNLDEVKAELNKAWEQIKGVEEEMMAEDEEVDEVEMAEDRPAWRLYEEDAWVPKPIGVV
jgi:ribosomal biogenesis protein LAS1